jgi:hypothetical protein
VHGRSETFGPLRERGALGVIEAFRNLKLKLQVQVTANRATHTGQPSSGESKHLARGAPRRDANGRETLKCRHLHVRTQSELRKGQRELDEYVFAASAE